MNWIEARIKNAIAVDREKMNQKHISLEEFQKTLNRAKQASNHFRALEKTRKNRERDQRIENYRETIRPLLSNKPSITISSHMQSDGELPKETSLVLCAPITGQILCSITLVLDGENIFNGKFRRLVTKNDRNTWLKKIKSQVNLLMSEFDLDEDTVVIEYGPWVKPNISPMLVPRKTFSVGYYKSDEMRNNQAKKISEVSLEYHFDIEVASPFKTTASAIQLWFVANKQCKVF